MKEITIEELDEFLKTMADDEELTVWMDNNWDYDIYREAPSYDT